MDQQRRVTLLALSQFALLIFRSMPKVPLGLLLSSAFPSLANAFIGKQNAQPILSGLIGDDVVPGRSIELIIKGSNLGETFAVLFHSRHIAAHIICAQDTAVTVEVSAGARATGGDIGFTVCTTSGKANSDELALRIAVRSAQVGTESGSTPGPVYRGTPGMEFRGTPGIEFRGTPGIEYRGTPGIEFRGTPGIYRTTTDATSFGIGTAL